MILRLTTLDPLSCGKILAVIYFGLSLLVVPFFLLMILLGAAGRPSDSSANPLAMVAGTGVVFLVIFPLIYAALGFIAGALGAVAYNLAAKLTGGMQLTFTDPTPIRPDMYPPPAAPPR